MRRTRRHKSSKRRPSGRRPAPAALLERGFDFGVEARALFVSSVSFVERLRQAEIVACSYGTASSGALGVPVRNVALVGCNSEPLRDAFAEFKRWSHGTDDDAVKLIFIFLKDGGYLLSISPEYTRINRVFRGADRFWSAILMAGSYIKKFDTRHPAVRELREYMGTCLISPFLFGAATISCSSGRVPVLADVSPLKDSEPLLKFEAEFVDEEDIQPGTSHYPLLTLSQQSAVSKKTKKTLPTFPPEPRRQPAAYFSRRAATLERHFPVTIERIRAGRYSGMMTELNALGLRNWQVEQAVCNLLLSASLCNGRNFYPTLRDDDLTNTIAQALRERQERSDTPDLARFSTKEIVAQVRLDTLKLLREAGHLSSPSTLDTLQKRLAALDLLGPANA